MELIVKSVNNQVMVEDLEIGDVIIRSGEFLMKVGSGSPSELSYFINLTDIEEGRNRVSFETLYHHYPVNCSGVVYKAVVSLEVKS